MEFLTEFPEMGRQDLRDFKKGVDASFKEFSRTYGDALESFFEPLLWFLVWLEKLLTNALAYRDRCCRGACLARVEKLETCRRHRRGLPCDRLFRHVGRHDGDTGDHFGGHLAVYQPWHSPRHLDGEVQPAQAAITPVLDVMQTIPSFVYLIPVVMLLGIGKVPGLIAVCIYAIPPIVRLTNLGIRLVDKEVLEAADAFGADYKQRLFGVQIPLALPNIFAGVNQTIMMSLAMVVIASMIGVKGLGLPVLRAISNQYLALGLLNGLAIVTLAIIFDRVSQEYGRRLQAHRQGADHD